MTGLPFEVFVRHRGYRLPYPLHRWRLPEEREDYFPPEDFKPSEFDPVHLILERVATNETITLTIEGTPYRVTLEPDAMTMELAAWIPPGDESTEGNEGLWGRAGLYRIRVLCGSEAWVTVIEVQPHYLTFEQMGRMCADIERMSTWVAYDVLPYAPVLGSRMPRIARSQDIGEDPAIQYPLLKEAVPEALRTLRFLSASPHLALKQTYVATRAGGASRQDRRTIRMEERLSMREEGWSVLRTAELNYDIYENRFVKRLLQDLLRRLNQLQSRLMDALYELERQEDEVRRRLRRQFGDHEDRIRREEPLWTRPIRNRHSGLLTQIASCGRMRDSLASALRTDLLLDVPPLRGIARPTNVLQNDPHYSRLWSIYRILRLSDRGETSVAHRFHRRSRPSWELYEMWVAVQVIETCMRDLRFTHILDQTMAERSEEGVVFLYDTPRPARVLMTHETEPIRVEILYGGFIPISAQALVPRGKTTREDDTDAVLDIETATDWDSPETGLAAPSRKPDDFSAMRGEPSGAITEKPTGALEGEPSEASTEAPTGVQPFVEISGVDPLPSAPITKTDLHGSGAADVERGTIGADDIDSTAPLDLPHSDVDKGMESYPYPDRLLATRGVQTAPDIQVRFFDAESDELLGVLILDAKYKGGRRIWGREGGRLTDDRLILESYLLDIHRRDREESAAALYSEPADDIVIGSFALYPGERFGRDLTLEERRTADNRMGAVRVTPDDAVSDELTQLLLEMMARSQFRRRWREMDDGTAGLHTDSDSTDMGSDSTGKEHGIIHPPNDPPPARSESGPLPAT